MKQKHKFLEIAFVDADGILRSISTKLIEKEKYLFHVRNDYQWTGEMRSQFEYFIPIKQILLVEVIQDNFFKIVIN